MVRLFAIPTIVILIRTPVAADNVHQPTSQQPEGSSAVQGRRMPSNIPQSANPLYRTGFDHHPRKS